MSHDEVSVSLITQSDVIDSVCDALQYISYYHPKDFIDAMHEAWINEKSPSAKDAISQILINSRMCAIDKRPVCQDTGIVTVFVKFGAHAQLSHSTMSLSDMINEGVRRAFTYPDNPLRASIVEDPAGTRKNTRDNTPAVIHFEVVQGSSIDFNIAAKGGGSENKAKFAMLNPSDSIVDWVLKTVPLMGAGWCPPGMLGIGIGGTAEKAALMAKESLMEPVDIHQLRSRGPSNKIEELRLELFQKVNDLGIGAQGLGGLSTVLDVKIKDYPTHAASLPVCMIPNCAATRHVHFSLSGEGPATLTPPTPEDYPEIARDTGAKFRRVNLDSLDAEQICTWQPGEKILLSGKLLTGRDAAHKRMTDMLSRGEKLPVSLEGRFIYYVGPVDPVGNEVVGPAGPTTSSRMDKFTEQMLAETGLLGMVGKAERGDEAIDAIRKHKSVYLIAIGGAAYLVAKAIKKARVLAFEDLGMEAIYEFEIVDMPVTVAVDILGNSIHKSGPAQWKATVQISNIN